MQLPKTISKRALCQSANVDYQRFMRAYEGNASLTKDEDARIFKAIQEHISELKKVKRLDLVK